MIEFRFGWFAPHRCGSWLLWAFDAGIDRQAIAPTWTLSLGLLGFTLALVFGWGMSGYDAALWGDAK